MKSKKLLEKIALRAGRLFGAKNQVVAPPLLDLPVRFPFGPFQFRITLPRGQHFEIHVSTNLKVWTLFHSGRSEADSTDYVDSNAKNVNACFYRVYSSGIGGNVMGYVTLTLPPGYSIVSNPLKTLSSNVQSLFPHMPEGTSLNKFDAAASKLRANAVKNRRWTDPGQTLFPGEAALFFNPTSDYKTLNFVGEVLQGNQSNPVPAGFTLRGSMLPIGGRLDTALEFPVEAGDVFHMFDPNKQHYHIYTYAPETWERNPVILGVGEGFWTGKTTSRNWLQTFNP